MTRVETTTVMVEEAQSTPARAWRGFQRAQLRFPIVQIVLIFVVFAVGAGTLDGFGSFNSIRAMLVLAALVGIAATGQSLVILLGGFDLSVAGFMVAGALTVTQLSNHYGIGFGPAFVLMLVGAAILGGFVGWLCHRFTVQPLIITLAMGSIVVSLVQVQNDGQVSGAAPQWLSALSSPITPTLGFIPLPPIVFIWLAIALILWPFLRRTGPGRRLYFTGANERAAGLALVRTRWVWIAVFAFSAVMSSVAGVLLAGFAGNVNGTIGDPYLFQTLAVVIVGGTVFGGPGDYWRTVVGTLLLTLLSTVLIGQGFTTADRQILYGAVILMAMALYGREKRLSDRI